MLDMMLARTSFDDLSPELRRRIADEVDNTVAAILRERGGE